MPRWIVFVQRVPREAGAIQPDGSPLSFDEFLKTDQGKDLSGWTGGIQGMPGTLNGKPYAPGSWQDKLIEAFAGTHDFIGGKLSGLYDDEGNESRGLVAMNTWKLGAMVSIAVLLQGCTIGNGRICGPQTPRANCDPEVLEALLHPPKFITLWNQPGVSEEQKMRDWLACPGGRQDGGFGVDTKKLQQPGESWDSARKRGEDNFYRCLIRKGYRYRACEVGKMLDEVICEAPPKQ